MDSHVKTVIAMKIVFCKLCKTPEFKVEIQGKTMSHIQQTRITEKKKN